MQFNDLMRKVLEFLPDAELLEDNDGQIVIYTGLRCVQEDMDLIPFEVEERDD